MSHFQGDGVYAADVFAALLPLFNEQLVQVVSSALGDRIVRNCDPAAARLPTLQEVLARPGANGRGGAVLLYDPKTNAEQGPLAWHSSQAYRTHVSYRAGHFSSAVHA